MTKLRETRRQYLTEDTDGATAVTFALCLIPLFMLVGFPIDFNRLRTAQSTTQIAVDAAVLGSAKELSTNSAITDGDLGEYTVAVLDAELQALKSDVNCSEPAVDIDRASSTIDIKISCDMPTTMGAIIGIRSMSFDAGSRAIADETKLELALMLDLSGSMAGARITALRQAASDMVDTLIQPGSDQSRIALAPYSTSVNVGNFFSAVTGVGAVGGTTTTGATGLDFANCDSLPTVQEIVDCYNQVVDNILTGQISPELQNAIDNGLPFEEPTCVTEREGLFAKTDRDPMNNSFVGFASNRCPLPEIMPLTNDAQALKDSIAAMVPEGSTAGHLGIEWSWYVLAERWDRVWPTESEPAKYNDTATRKIAILMTDGQFNVVYDGTQGTSSEQAAIACSNMKQAGIVIYAVALQAPTEAQDVLRDCASTPAQFFSASSASELIEIYEGIAASIRGLRIVN